VQAIFWVSFGLLWVIVVIQGFAFLEVIRQVGQIRRFLGDKQGVLFMPDTVETGASLPELSGQAAETLQPAQWEGYLGPGLNLLILLTAHCMSCRHIAEELTGYAADIKKEATITAIVESREGQSEEALVFLRETKLDPRMVIVDEGGKTAKRLGVSWNPAVVTIYGRKIGKAAIVNDVYQLHGLLHQELEVENAIP
jgi:hypothetical protein